MRKWEGSLLKHGPSCRWGRKMGLDCETRTWVGQFETQEITRFSMVSVDQRSSMVSTVEQWIQRVFKERGMPAHKKIQSFRGLISKKGKRMGRFENQALFPCHSVRHTWRRWTRGLQWTGVSSGRSPEWGRRRNCRRWAPRREQPSHLIRSHVVAMLRPHGHLHFHLSCGFSLHGHHPRPRSSSASTALVNAGRRGGRSSLLFQTRAVGSNYSDPGAISRTQVCALLSRPRCPLQPCRFDLCLVAFTLLFLSRFLLLNPSWECDQECRGKAGQVQDWGRENNLTVNDEVMKLL